MGFLNAKVKKSLLSSFEEVSNSVTNVNYGGCGFFAKHLHDLLLKKGFNPELVILVSEWSVDSANEYISNNAITPLFNTGWSHVMVKISTTRKVFYIDTCGFFDDLLEHPNFGYCEAVDLPVNILNSMLKLRYKGKWNPTFKRDNHKKIKKILKKHLEI